MDQLIEITSVPIQIEVKTSRARLECAQGTAEMEISRAKDRVSIKSKPIRLNMDTFEPSRTKTAAPVRRAEPITYQASADFSQQGQLMMRTTLDGSVLAQLSGGSAGVQPILPDGGNAQAEAQPEGGEAGWDPAELNIRYEMDKLNFDFKIGQNGFEFIPGDIEVTITQRPEVTIKYIGGPLYVPPSADPSYEPVDVKA